MRSESKIIVLFIIAQHVIEPGKRRVTAASNISSYKIQNRSKIFNKTVDR